MPRIRSGEPIHRDSFEKGTFEKGWFRPLSRTDANRLEAAAQRHDRETRAKGRHGGACGGRVGLSVLAVMIGLNRGSHDGRVDCSWLWLSRKAACSIDALGRALDRLELVGIIERVRRVTRADDHSWRQTSNAYRLALPTALLAALPAVMTPPPMPDDAALAAADREATSASWSRELPPAEWAATEFGEGPLGAALARWRTNLESRDSGFRNESPCRSLTPGHCGVGLPADNLTAKGVGVTADGLSGGRVAGSDTT